MYNYNYDYDYYNTAAASSIIGGFLVFYLFILFISIAAAVVEIIAIWKVFKKAGKEGWEAIIPFYNLWTLFEISGYPGYYMFFGFIPCVGIFILLVFKIMAAISLSKKFNKSGGFAALLVLVPVVGYSILGFGKDEYNSSLGEQRDTSETSNITVEDTKKSSNNKFCGNCGTKVSASANVCPNCGNKLK